MKTILIPNVSVLVVEDSLARRHWFLSRYRLPEAFLAHEPVQAIDIIRQFEPQVCFLDYDLGVGINSLEIAAYLRDTKYGGRVILHSQNDFGRMSLAQIIRNVEIAPYGTFEIVRTRDK
jgi:hypothetical protein